MLLAFACWTILVSISSCITHWHVTETGRIESKEDSPFTLLRPYDLAAFLKQMHRLERLDTLKEIIASKEISKSSEMLGSKNDAQSVDTYQEKFYKLDSDCLKASQQLAKFTFFETNYIDWDEVKFSFASEVLDIKKSDIITFKKPYCDQIETEFRFDKSFDHLNSIQSYLNITMLPELDLTPHLLIKPEDYFGHLVYKSLLLNSSSWMYLTMASEFFRIKGDYVNSINCYKRALYYVPKEHSLIPLLSFSNMLHKLHFINDSLSVAIAGVSANSEDFSLAYYLGNIYVTLGELNEAYFWYEKASKMDPTFRNCLLKKHATACHIKLEHYLEEQHSNLQKKLEELKDYQAYSDEWFQLSSKIELEKSSKDRKDFTKKVYKEFTCNPQQSIICDWSKNNENFRLDCNSFPLHYTSFPLYNQTLTLKEFNSFYAFLIQNNRNFEYNTCVNFEECKSATQEKNFSNSQTQTDDTSTTYLNDNESPKNGLKSHLLNERNVKNRFEPPSFQ